MQIPNHYCTALHAGLLIGLEPDGSAYVSPCPIQPFRFSLTDDRVFNHPNLVNLRTRNKETQHLELGCLECSKNACLGLCAETRNASNIRYINDHLLYDQKGPKVITFLLNYVCNLACATCTPLLSTKWRTIEKVKSATELPQEQIKKILSNLDLSQLETVHIFGGEPLLTNTHEIILKELEPYQKNITVWYDTNGTVFPSERTLELWQGFHLIRLKYSIDAVDAGFEYMRWPASWSQVQDTILKMIEQLPVNHMISLRPAIGFLNIHVVKDIRDWYLKSFPTNRLGDPTEFEYNPVYGIFRAANMPPAMERELRSIYPEGDPVLKMIPPLSGDPNILIDIKKKLVELDRARGLDYKQALPHLIPYLNDV